MNCIFLNFLQDFEDWDDVGLNIPKPPDLLHLYRDFGSHVTPITDTEEAECYVNFTDEILEEKLIEFDQLRGEMVRLLKKLMEFDQLIAVI